MSVNPLAGKLEVLSLQSPALDSTGSSRWIQLSPVADSGRSSLSPLSLSSEISESPVPSLSRSKIKVIVRELPPTPPPSPLTGPRTASQADLDGLEELVLDESCLHTRSPEIKKIKCLFDGKLLNLQEIEEEGSEDSIVPLPLPNFPPSASLDVDNDA